MKRSPNSSPKYEGKMGCLEILIAKVKKRNELFLTKKFVLLVFSQTRFDFHTSDGAQPQAKHWGKRLDKNGK